MNTNRIRDMIENLGAETILRHFVVIPKGDLPEVTTDQCRASVGPFSANTHDGAAANRVWGHALAALALAAHLDANPPVDEADVDALADLMDDIEAENIYDHHELARRLLQTGHVQVSCDE